MDDEIRQTIVKTIDEHIQDGSTFTAFDITRELRVQGFRVIHSEVKEIVHQRYADHLIPSYTRELRPVGPNGEVAWHYYPEPASATPGTPSGALPGHLTPSSVRTYGTTTLDDPDPTPPPEGGGAIRTRANPLVKPPDRRKRLLVPAWMTSAIGLAPGNLACLHREGGGKRLEVTTLTLGRPPWKRLFVRRCGGLYISAKDQREFSMIMSHRQIEIVGNALHVLDSDGK